MRITITAIFLAATAMPAAADSGMLAIDLATVIAGEKFCDLTYDQDAIGAWIEKHVAADDMAFAGQLRLFVSGKEREQKSIGTSEKTAHCRQIARVAKANGFVK